MTDATKEEDASVAKVLARAAAAFENELYDLQNRLRLYEIACREIHYHRGAWRDQIVEKIPELDGYVIHVLYKDDADALDHAVGALSELPQGLCKTFHESLSPAIERAMGAAA